MHASNHWMWRSSCVSTALPLFWLRSDGRQTPAKTKCAIRQSTEAYCFVSTQDREQATQELTASALDPLQASPVDSKGCSARLQVCTLLYDHLHPESLVGFDCFGVVADLASPGMDDCECGIATTNLASLTSDQCEL